MDIKEVREHYDSGRLKREYFVDENNFKGSEKVKNNPHDKKERKQKTLSYVDGKISVVFINQFGCSG